MAYQQLKEEEPPTLTTGLLAYLNAALLEPLLSIASDEEATTKHLLVDLMQLLGLVFWTYMITDAFDTADTASTFVFRYKVRRASSCGGPSDGR